VTYLSIITASTHETMADEPVTFRLAETAGTLLGGRPLAAAVREAVAARAQAGEVVVVDLEGVDAMSPSFADELFAKLSPELLASGRVRINVTPQFAPLVQVMIQRRSQSGE
jgi:hypothetical protein